MEDKIKKIIAYVLITAITFGSLSGMESVEVSAAEASTTVISEEDVTDEIISESETETTTEVMQDTETDTTTEITVVEEIDKTELESKIEEASAIQNEEYTEESWNVLQETIANAQAILNSTDATETDVADAIAALETAINDLEVTAEETLTVGIEIESEPTKKDYASGEELDVTGLGVNAVYSDDSKVALEATDYQVSGFDSSVMGEQTITVTYGGYTATFIVNVWVAYGICGENLTWTLDEAGELKISGTGDMWDFASGGAPWYSQKANINSLVLEEGITSIGQYAFTYYSITGELIIPSTVTRIGGWAFMECNNVNTLTVKCTSYPEIATCAFSYMYGLRTVKAPKASVSKFAYNMYLEREGFSNELAFIPVLDNGEELELTGIRVVEEPWKTTYLLGEAFKTTGLAVKAVYSDGSEIYVYNIKASGYDTNVLGEQIITVTHAGYTTTFTVTVSEKFTGTCGENLTWTLNYDGTFEISGTGAMEEYASGSEVPWNSERANIKKLTLSDELTTISDSVFSGCSNLTGELTIPSGVTSIGNSAFYGCSNLTGEIVIPSGVTSIGNNVFYNCSNITAVIFKGNTVPTFGNYAFSNSMTALKNIYVPEVSYDSYVEALSGMVSDTVEFVAVQEAVVTGIEVESEPTKKDYASGEELDVTGLGVNAVYSDDSKVALEATDYQVSGFDSSVMGEQTITVTYGEYTVTFTVNVWVAYGTCGENLTWTLDEAGELRISGTGDMTNWTSNTSVPWYAYNEQIKTLVLEEGMTCIGAYAFNSCYKNTGGLLVIPESVKSVGSCAFSGCTGFTGELILPEGIESIGSSAFYNCTGFTGELKIPTSVNYISQRAFSECDGLTSVEFSENVGNIDYLAFAYCAKLGTLIFKGMRPSMMASFYLSPLKNVYVPAKALDDFSSAFDDAEIIPVSDTGEELNVVSVEITTEPTKTEYLYGESLSLSGIKGKITYNDGSEAEVTNFTASGYDAFSVGEQEITVTFYGVTDTFNVTVVASGSLTETITWVLDPEDGVLTISGTGTMPEYTSVNSIPWYYARKNINTVIIEGSVTSISGYAFYEMSNLSGEIEIPASVTKIGDSAFYGCTGLTSIIIPDNVTSIGGSTFHNCTGLTSIVIPDNVTSIGNSAFFNCTGLTSIVIPDNVTSIGSNAFYNCTGLTSIDIPSSLTVIENYTFGHCTGLSNIEIPNGIQTISYNAFINCKGLNGVLVIPDSVQTISYGAFYNCTGVTGLVLGKGLTKLGVSNTNYNSPFRGMSSVTKVTFKSQAVPTIYKNPFQDMTNLKVICVPEASLDLYKEAFSSYAGESVTYVSMTEEVVLECMEIVSLPSKTTYVVNEELDTTGLVVHAVYSDGSKVETTDYVITYDTSTKGDKVVTLTQGEYGENTVAFKIKVLPSGTCGTSLYWKLEDDGTLIIYGNGAMTEQTNQIYYPWYSIKSQIKAIVIENGVTSIGQCAFASGYYSHIQGSLMIPETVTKIGMHAFSGCAGLDGTLTLSSGIINIGAYAFRGCKDIKGSLVIPDSVTTIGSYAFYECAGFTGSLTIPDSVTTINEYAFNGCTGFDGNLTLSSGLTTLGKGAFNGCSGFTGKLVIPQGITSIGTKTFCDCNGLTGELVIPNNVKTISESAFYNCNNLNSIVIPSSVTSIGTTAFANCSAVDEITFEGTAVPTTQTNTFNSMSDLRKVKVLQSVISKYASSYGTQFSGQVAFIPITEEGEELELTGIEIVTEPSKKDYLLGTELITTGLKVNAVYSDESEVTITNYTVNGFDSETVGEKEISVSHAGYNATFKVNILENLNGTCGDSLTWVLDADGKLTISGTGDMDDYSNSSRAPWNSDRAIMEKITIEDGVTSIGDYAFYESTTLNNVEISDSIDSIGSSAFSGCTGLTTIKIPDSVTEIGSYAFNNCTALMEVKLSESLTKIAQSLFYGCSKLLYVNIPENVTSIEQYAFYNCSVLDDIMLPESLTDIGTYAFYQCEGLTSVIIPGSVENFGSSVFGWCDKLERVEIQDGITKVPANTFAKCSSLTTVIIPDSVTTIGNSAFFNCANIEDIEIPSSVTNIEGLAFYACYQLSDLELPEKLTNIGERAFYACTALEGELKLPVGVQSIDGGAFSGCSGITMITFEGVDIPSFPRMGSFNNMVALEKIRMPKETFDDYVGAIKKYNTIADTVEFVPIAESGEELEVTSIELTIPNKKDYIAGFDLDLTGMQVYAVFSDETKQEVKNYTVSTFDKVTVGDQTLTVTYLGKTATFAVTVHEAATPSQIINVTAISDATGIYLTWSMAAEVTTDVYCVYRKAESEETFSLLAEVEGRDTLSYKDTTVEEGIVYEYYVTGKNAAELEGVASATVSETLVVDEEAPVVTKLSPDNGNYLVGTKQISMTAQDNVGVTKAELYYSLDAGESWILFGEGTSGEFNVSLDTTELPDGEIRVKGVAYDAKDNESTALTYAYYVDNTGPEQVQGLAYESTSVTITLSWEDVADDDISYYAVEKKQVDGSYIRVATISKTLGANLTGLIPDTEYVYRVAGYDLRGNRGVVSETITATTQPDTTIPVITQIRPVSGYYADALNLTVKAEDEFNVASLIIQISEDALTWTDIETKVYADVSNTRTYEYTCSLEEYEEGTIYVRAIAIDSAGNESNSGDDAPFVQYMIDRTAPAAPENTEAQGGDGYIEISWTQGSEADLGTYTVYRAEAEEGEYTKIADKIAAINYFDQSVEEDITYYYKVSVNDKAGNESEYSAVVSATAIPDEEKPEIISIYPEIGSNLGTGYCTVSVLVTDNQLIDRIVFEYSNNAVSYIELSVKEEINANNATVTAKVPVDEFAHGDNLYIRATAYDKAGNESERAGQQYVVDIVAPMVSSAKAEYEADYVEVSWTGEPSSDLLGYRIYRKTGADGAYSLIAQKKAVEGQNEYSCKDQNLELEAISYYYMVESLDSCGNTYSVETEALVLEDRTIPTAVISCESTMEKDVEYIIDASGSKDNSVIMAYLFDFGDGTTSTDKQAVHKYAETGEYTITLTVTDDEGNTSTVSKTVSVKERELIGTVKIRVVDEDGNAVSGAPVYFDLGEEKQVVKKTDSSGYASFTSEVGKHTVGCVIADNEWLPAKKEIIVTAGAETNTELTMIHYTMIEGQFEVKRMTFEEIKAAGIDVSAPENQYFVQVDVTLNYGAEVLKDTTIYYNPSTGETISPPVFVETPDGEKHQIIPGVIVPEDDTDGTTISVAYLEVPVGVSVLKDFFNVNLHIINNASSEFSMQDNLITLNLPEGLTLMETETTAGKTSVSIEEIKGQTTETISWLIRGDQTGEYYLSADYSGMLSEFNETIYTSFVSTEPIKIYGMSDMKLIVEVAEELDEGKGYYNMILQNNGTEDAYLPEIETADVLLKTELFDEAGINILDENEEKPDVLAGGYSFVKGYISEVEVEDTEWTYELQEYMLSMKNTYGIETEMVTKPLSYFVENEEVSLEIINQPENQLMKVGETAVFTVEAEGEALSYQWQYSNDGGMYWHNSGMTGNDTNTLTVPVLEKRNGQMYRCVIKDGNAAQLITNIVTLTVYKETKLAIVTQPIDQTAIVGEAAVFTVEAEGEGLSYQWQYSNDGGIYWHNSGMTGNDTNSLTVTAIEKRNGQMYRCLVTDGMEEVMTNEVTLSVTKNSEVAINTQPTDQTVEEGTTAVFTVGAEGEGLCYQWQYSKNGGTHWYDSGMTGSTTNTLSVVATVKRNGQQYRCVITDVSGNEVITETAMLIIAGTIKINTQPVSQNVSVGEIAVFSVEAQGNNLEYQWQYSNNGGTYWYDSGMTGSTTNTLSVAATAKRDGQMYRCVITDKDGNKVISEISTLILN